MTMARLSEAELDRLEHYLDAPDRSGSTMPLDMVQGLLAAAASGPTPVPSERWMPEVLGEAHEFESPGDEREITELLERFAQDTARQLNDADGFDFILYGEDDDLGPWAEGYLVGVELAEPRWEEVADEEDLDNILFPFLALTGDAKQMALDAGESWMDEEEESRMLAEIREGFATHLLDVREYFFEKAIPSPIRREGPKVGRNDPCPCGSGKKYKSCHGA